MEQYIISGIIGLIGILIGRGSLLFIDRIKFGVEKLKENTAYHRKLISDWQEMISLELKDTDGWNLYESTQYISMRPYLSDKAKTVLEPVKRHDIIVVQGKLTYQDGVAGDDRLNLLQDEITRIQKSWKLF